MQKPVTLPASEIQLTCFRQIFHWPLVLCPTDAIDAKTRIHELIHKQCELLDKSDNWCALTGNKLFEFQHPVCGVSPYTEFTYFHDFVQDFLYPPESEKATPLHVYKRKNVSDFQVEWKDFKHKFDVDMVQLHLFDYGVAILTVEISCGAKLTLAQAQTATDYMRRAFPGFFYNNETPGLSPVKASFVGEPVHSGTQEDYFNAAKDNRHQKIFPWWCELICDLDLIADCKDSDTPKWRHILDERIPVMTFMAIDHKNKTPARALGDISDGDWFRIASADKAGESELPYNEDFLKQTLDKDAFCDRFFPTPGKTDPNEATRFSFAGYHFAAVGSGKFFEELIQQHFRRHYRQMVFLVHLEFASLLAFSSRLTRLVKDSAENPEIFKPRLQQINDDFLAYTHRYRFTHVSNHLQGREIFRKLRQSLQLQDLYDDVKEELDTATSARFNQAQEEATETATSLTVLATIFLPISIILGGFELVKMMVSAAPDLTMIPNAPVGSKEFYWQSWLPYLMFATFVYFFFSMVLSSVFNSKQARSRIDGDGPRIAQNGVKVTRFLFFTLYSATLIFGLVAFLIR